MADIYTMNRQLIGKVGDYYLHDSWENFLASTKNIGSVFRDILKDVRIESENVLRTHEKFLKGEARKLVKLLKEKGNKPLGEKTLIKSIRDVYKERINSATFSIYYLNKAKDSLLEMRKMADSKKSFSNKTLKEFKETFKNFEKEIKSYFDEAAKIKTMAIEKINPFDKELRDRLNISFEKVNKDKEKVLINNKSFLFLKKFVEKASSSSDLKTAMNILRGSGKAGEEKKVVDFVIEKEIIKSLNIDSPFGFSFEDALLRDILNSVFDGVVDSKKLGDIFQKTAVVDLSFNLTGVNAGFSVKHYDMYSSATYSVPESIDILFEGMNKTLFKEYSYIRNNWLYLFEKPSELLFNTERELIRLRMFSRFIDTFVKQTSKTQVNPISTLNGQELDNLEHTLFWITKSDIFWTHDLIKLFLSADFKQNVSSWSDKNFYFNISYTEGPEYILSNFEEREKLFFKKREAMSKMKDGVNYEKIAKNRGVKKEMEKLIKSWNLTVPFFRKVKYTMRFNNIRKILGG